MMRRVTTRVPSARQPAERPVRFLVGGPWARGPADERTAIESGICGLRGFVIFALHWAMRVLQMFGRPRGSTHHRAGAAAACFAA